MGEDLLMTSMNTIEGTNGDSALPIGIVEIVLSAD